VDRAKLRTTAAYRFHPRFQAGLEWNPLDDDLGPIANWVAVTEGERRPALILGTSSDRIGTPDGRALYATLSKDVEELTGLPVAPYAGVSYGGFEHDFEAIGGLHVRWSPELSTTHLYDGENLHHLLTIDTGGGSTAGFVVAEQDGELYLGATLGLEF